jgi:CCR4-NOT transcription complex subunit 2
MPFGNGMGGGGFANPGAAMSGGLFGGMDGMGSADGYGVVSLQKPHPEFQMQTEDFPALPGAPGMGGGKGGGLSGLQGANFPPMQRAGSNAGGFPGLGAGGPKPGGEGYPNGAAYGQTGQSRSPPRFGGAAGGASPYDSSGDGGGQRGSASAEVANFGLLGLLGVIRMSDPDVTTLALGTDLTTLGLNLNSPEPLYKTFGSPWSDAPPRRELELALPACYSVRARRLHKGAFAKFQQETLFYVFYSMPGDESQLFAADELVARGWGFHKELKAWLSRVAGTEPVQKTERGERGSFWIFDAGAWDRVRKDNFNLQYDQLEARPAVKRDAPATSRAAKEGNGGAGGGLLVGAE